MSAPQEGAGLRVGRIVQPSKALGGPHQYTPSAENRMRAFFAARPDEELTKQDAIVKFSVCEQSVMRAFRTLVAEGLLVQEGRRGEMVWRGKEPS